MKKKIIILICSIILVLCAVLTGCNTNRTPGSDVIEDLQTDEYGKPIFKDVNLKVWSIIGAPDNVYLEKVNRMFNDYYRSEGIQADVKSITDADYYTQLANTVNTDPDNAPDVVIFHSERLPKLAADKIIVPMKENLELGQTNFKDEDYLKATIEQCYLGDTLYGVPLDIAAGVWYVRTDILEKNGLEVPTNLQEFEAVNNALIDKAAKGELWHRAMSATSADARAWKKTAVNTKYNPVVMCAGSGVEAGMIPQSIVVQNGGSIVGADGKPAWNTPALETMYGKFRNWQTGEGLKGPFIGKDESPETVWSRIANGSAVFSAEGPWWIEKRFDEYETFLGKETDDQGKTYRPLDIINMSKLYALDPNSEHADKIYGIGHSISTVKTVESRTVRVAAALYARFMSQNAVDYTQGGHLPAAKAILESEEYTSKPFYKRYLEKFGDPNNFVMLGSTPHYEAIFATLGDSYRDVLTESKKNIAIDKIIKMRYDEAIQLIESIEDL